MCSIITPEFLSSDYVSFGLTDNWLTNFFNQDPSSFNNGYLLISQTNGLNNGRFKIPDSSSFRVYSSNQTPGVNGSSATDGQLTAGDKIYYYDGGSTYTLIGTVDNQLDGLYDDLKIHFTADTSSTYLSSLGIALQYAGESVDSRSFDVSLSVDGSTPVVDTLPFITFNKTGDGFTFVTTKPSYSENGSAVFVAGSSDTTIAYSAKDTLSNNAGNYNGTNLVITATNDLTALASQFGSPSFSTPEGISALLKEITVMFSELSTHVLNIDASGKSFSYDAQAQTLNDVNGNPFASVVIGDSNAGVTNTIAIKFNSDLATTALVNEVLQSITYQNTTDSLMSLGVLSWKLQYASNNNSSLVSGQSLLTFQNVNDAPILQPFYKTESYDALLDFATQDYKATAAEAGVYSSTGTEVLSGVNVTANDTSFTGISSVLGFLSNQSAVMVGDLTTVGGNTTSSVITFDTPQSSVSLEFANLLKTLVSLIASGDQAAVSNLVGGSTQTFLMGLPYRKVSFYDENTELLGVSQITDLNLPSLGLLFSIMALTQGGSASDLDTYTSDSLYNVRFTAPQGQAIKSIKIESVSTTLSQLLMSGAVLPSILDSITLGENIQPYLNLPPLIAGQATEFVIGDMLPNGTITDPDALPWEKSTVPESIAVSAVDNSQGLWEYKIGNGTWTAFDFTANSGKALLLNETDSLQFTPNQDFNGVLPDCITFYAWDKTTGNVGNYLTISGNTGGDKTLSVNAISASAMTPQVPTLSEITTITPNGDGEQVITFASLLDASNAHDLDGTVTAFVVKNVSSGTLKIGTDAASATDWAEGTNDTITVLKKAFWTPGSSGNAFTVVAKDNDNTESVTPIQVKIAINAAPTIANVPETPTDVIAGVAADLENFTVADINVGDTLTVTLTATNGTIGGVEDDDLNADGIQVTGTTDEINAKLAAATFTATKAWTASVNIRLTDGHISSPVTAIYPFTVSANPEVIKSVDNATTVLVSPATTDSTDWWLSSAKENNVIFGTKFAETFHFKGTGNANIIDVSDGDALVLDAATTLKDNTVFISNEGNDVVVGSVGTYRLGGVNPEETVNVGFNGNIVEISRLKSGFSYQAADSENKYSITGSTAGDSITGGAVSDTITGGLGADTIDGGAGDDKYVISATGQTGGVPAYWNVAMSGGTPMNPDSVTSTVSTVGMDIYTMGAGDTLDLSLIAPTLTSITATTAPTPTTFHTTSVVFTAAGTETAAQSFRGSYANANNTFTWNVSGTDTLLVYDNNGSADGGKNEAVVLVGIPIVGVNHGVFGQIFLS